MGFDELKAAISDSRTLYDLEELRDILITFDKESDEYIELIALIGVMEFFLTF